MIKKGILILSVLILASVTMHYLDVIDLPLLPPWFKAGSEEQEPDFELSANSSMITLKNWIGSSNSTTITVKSVNGFNHSVTFKIKRVRVGFLGTVDDLKFELQPHHVYLPAGGEGSCVLTVEIRDLTTLGVYYVDVDAVAGDVKHSICITVRVTD